MRTTRYRNGITPNKPFLRVKLFVIYLSDENKIKLQLPSCRKANP